MSDNSKIEWTDASWNPVTGCTKVSPGCDHCYAETFAERWRGTAGHHFEQGFDVKLWPSRMDIPLRWKKPRRIFVNSMSDVFHEAVPDSFIAEMFAVMAASPQHTFQILTKRHGRLRSLLNSESFVCQVQRQVDTLEVARQIAAMGEEVIVPIAGYPGYHVSDHGRVLTGNGSDCCLWCLEPRPASAMARWLYCSSKCRQKAYYEQKMGRWEPPAYEMGQMSPECGEQGHQRVTLYRDGEPHRELVHRLVLSAFDREPEPGEQGCHINGDPSVNALPNLRWGTQEDNWEDRKRHGNGRSYFKVSADQVGEIKRAVKAGELVAVIARRFGISDTQVRNIASGRQWSYTPELEWPIPGVWLGVSVEDQKRAGLRISALLDTPAAVRFISAEPLLGPVNIWHLIDPSMPSVDCDKCGEERFPDEIGEGHDRIEVYYGEGDPDNSPKEGAGWCPGPSAGTLPRQIDWIIAGGESGPGARPCELGWLRDLRQQCEWADIPFFCKQLGKTLGLELGAGSKGGDWDAWPEDLRVREFPQTAQEAAA
jgi:protein gp37